ncbi:MAG: hypothetical protein HQL64_14140 [Magnetococcales bacterium]|nr:hypothetical protein [Magnetococcales bacterium]
MTKRYSTLDATLKKTLLYFDGPQIMLLTDARHSIIVAVAVERDDMEQPFFACRVDKRHWEKYMSGKADLHYLFSNALSGVYYFFDLAAEDKSIVELRLALPDEIENNDFWPETGFFSSSHTETMGDSKENTSICQIFNIDGSWDIKDFSQFNNGIFDIYVISYLRVHEFSESIRTGLSELVPTRLWTAGGSYISFFKKLAGWANLGPLRVKRIQYASPGQIELLGNEEVFNKMIHSIRMFGRLEKEISEAYGYIDKTLDYERLKTAKPPAEFSCDVIEESVREKANFILQSVGIENPDVFLASCGGDVLVYAKIVLSICRRIQGVHNFISEGRVQIKDQTPQ